MYGHGYAGFRRRTGGAYSMPEPCPQGNKGASTDVKVPDWLTQFYRSTAGKNLGMQNYFLGNLTPQGKIAPPDPDVDVDPFKRDPFKPEVPLDEVGAKAAVSTGTGTGTGGDIDQPAVLQNIKDEFTFPGTGTKTDPTISPPGGPDAASGYDINQLLGFNPEATPGLSPWQQLVGQNIGELVADPMQEIEAGRLALGGIGSAERTPGVTAEDPTIKALKDVFQGSTKELLKNEATMGGYNRGSAVPDVLAKNWMAQLAPALEAQMGRGERAIERGQRATETAIGQQTGAAAARAGRLAAAFGVAVPQGALERGIETERAAKNEAEKMRLRALAEGSVGGPMGLLPTSIGSKTGKAK